MHGCKSAKHLLCEVLDMLDRNEPLVFLGLAQLPFKTVLAKLHHDVLDDSPSRINRVEELDKLNDVWSSFEKSHDLVLTRDHVASLLSALDCHFHVPSFVKCLEYET